MKPEPLKGKRIDVSLHTIPIYAYYEKDIKSAVKGLIKFHNDRIEKLIRELRLYGENNQDDKEARIQYKNWIDREYESIMEIEYWMEDAI